MSPATNHGPTTISPNFVGSSQGSQFHTSPDGQVGLGGGHLLTHSRSSSNLGGDDGERDVDWEDEDGMNASVSMTGIGIGGSQGGEEWDAQGARFNFGAGGLNVPGFTWINGSGAPPGGEEWKRWAEGEISKEKKRVEKLVGVVKALVDVTGKGAASAGGATASMSIDRESDISKLSFAFDPAFAY